jgi:hypothetical protein
MGKKRNFKLSRRAYSLSCVKSCRTWVAAGKAPARAGGGDEKIGGARCDAGAIGSRACCALPSGVYKKRSFPPRSSTHRFLLHTRALRNRVFTV